MNAKTNEQKNKGSWVLPFLSSSVQNGFTLIEIIIYTGLVALVLGTAVLSTHAALQIRGNTRSSLILEESMRFAMHQITDTIQRAESVMSPALGSPASTLVLDMRASAEDPTTFTLTTGTIMRTEGAGAATALTTPDIEITTLTFTRMSGSPAPVRILMSGRTRGAGSASYTNTLSLTALALPH